MKLHSNTNNPYSVLSYSADTVTVRMNTETVHYQRGYGVLCLSSERGVCPVETQPLGILTQASFEALKTLEAQVVIIGTGAAGRIAASILRPLIEAQIGFEQMDNASACRTFNVLAQEGRHVVLLLPMEST